MVKEIFKGKVVGVLGLGRTGISVAKFVRNAKKVYLLDSNDEATVPKDLKKPSYELRKGKDYLASVPKLDFLFISPGVPLTEGRKIASVRSGHTNVLNDTELFLELFEGTSVGITGTNGKTTTTSLVGHILKTAGESIIVAGNIGESPLGSMSKKADRAVIELSSFQLEAMHNMPGIAVVLNITPDHFDRHGTFKKYVEAKSRILSLQEEGDIAILNYDDEEVRGLAKRAKGEVFFFSRDKKLDNGFWLKKKNIVFGNSAQKICSVRGFKLIGGHNLENALAAAAVSYFLFIPKKMIEKAFRTFKAPEHRIEHVRTWRGISFYNDSKATTPDSTLKALEAFSNKSVVLITGGYDKGLEYGELGIMVASQAKHLVANGPTGITIATAAVGARRSFIRRVSIYKQCSMEGLVNAAIAEAEAGDVVLLSPASASFDMYKDYEERGREFKRVVTSLE